MHWDEVVRAAPLLPPEAGAPEWAMGCFRRQSITFFTADSDSKTRVYWLQSRRLSADLRIRADRPNLLGRLSPAEATVEEIEELVHAEGGVATASWDGSAMRWADWTAFQVHDKWPEPAELRRVGDCLIEFAPSGAYVEDWRLQPGSCGVSAGLQLIEERNLETGEVTHRGGGLVVCGRHAALVLGRPAALDLSGRLADAVRHRPDPALIRAIFSCEASYGVWSGDGFIVAASTDPLREGEPLMAWDGFEWTPGRDRLIQRIAYPGIGAVERIFAVDSLEVNVVLPTTTPVSDTGDLWLRQEADTLLALS